jgi:hypothetical protein
MSGSSVALIQRVAGVLWTTGSAARATARRRAQAAASFGLAMAGEEAQRGKSETKALACGTDRPRFLRRNAASCASFFLREKKEIF